jgi:Tannase and feruloyl esterase
MRAMIYGGLLLTVIGVQDAFGVTRCEDLAKFHAADVTIVTATSADTVVEIPAGPSQLHTPVCRVNGFLTPRKDSHIGFEVWLPPADAWNHKYQAVGNGGLSGALSYRAMLPGFNRGYATMTTDLGHTNTPPSAVEDATWALGHPEKVVDYAYRGEHLATVVAKKLIEAYYGNALTHSYFTGCSAGGIAGMTELLRYPEDYDGYIIGDATPDHLGQEIGALWNTLAASLANPAEALQPAQITLVHQEILRQCVGKDGGAPSDPFLTDPTACHFDPKALQCAAGQNSPSCLSSAQVEIFQKIYQGPVDPRTHEAILSGLTPGSELLWGRYFVGKKNPVEPDRPWAGFLTDMVYSDPQYLIQQKYLTFDFDRDYQAVRRQKVAGESLDASWNTRNRNLDTFRQAGGRIIHYHGWDDPNIPALEAVRFFMSVAADQAARHRLSPEQALQMTQQFYRLFMVPGMGHCFGGEGPSSFGQNGQRATQADPEHDTLLALERWVEGGVAPEHFVASRLNTKTGESDMTRPICAYPRKPVWNGSGSVSEASNFKCIDPRN